MITRGPKDLPPHSGVGWPWESSNQNIADTSHGIAIDRLPKISVIVPSYNNGLILEQALRSILLQQYPNVEILILDAGSDLETMSIIKKYEKWITYWRSHPDRGQSAAINEGAAKSNGELLTWLGADDIFMPGALMLVGSHFLAHRDCEWLAGRGEIYFPERSRRVAVKSIMKRPDDIVRFWLYASEHCFIFQTSCFWRRSLWNRCGGLREDLHLAMDYELWMRFAHCADLTTIDQILSVATRAPGGKSHDRSREQQFEGMMSSYEHAPSYGISRQKLTYEFLQYYVVNGVKRAKWAAEGGDTIEAIRIVIDVLCSPVRVMSKEGRLTMIMT